MLGFRWVSYRSFEELEVWQLGCRLAISVYDALRDCRDYGLRDQMTRPPSQSHPTSPKGAERDSIPDFKRFLHIAKGSAAELRTQLYIAQRIGIITPQQQKTLTQQTKQIAAMLQNLSKSLTPKLLKPKT